MRDNFKRILDGAGKVADIAVQKTTVLVEKGRSKMEQYSIERKIEKMQCRLGVLTYTMVKSGENNTALIQRYVEEIDFLNTELAIYTGAAVNLGSEDSPITPDMFTRAKDEFNSEDTKEKKVAAAKPSAKRPVAKKDAGAKKTSSTKKPVTKKTAATAKKATAGDGAVFLDGAGAKLSD